MDHARIDENQLADRYLMGKLDDTERPSFEEHFVDCPVCLERLETVEGLRGALKELPSGFSAASTATPTSLDRFARPRVRPLVTFLAAACLLMATAASLFFYGETRRARRELEAVRQASEKARQRQAELEGALQRERTPQPRPSDDTAMSALAGAPLAATVFTLNLTRGTSSEPGDRVQLPEPLGWLVLLFDRPDRPDVSRYRVRLSTTGGHPVGEPVTASAASGGMLAVSLPSALLSSGDYLLAVEDAGSGNVLATYRFRAAPRR
jgi:hypothetical protein